jgi:hypothetical protein
MKTIKLLALAAVVLIGCGDNKSMPDARMKDSSTADAYCSNCPAAPMLGAQIDRMGRPAVNTVLTRGFDAPALAAAAKQAYNEDSSLANWATNVPEFMTNLAMIDLLDSGICNNGLCELGEGNVAGTGVVACPADCPTVGQVGSTCPNGVCEIGETNTTCAADCPTAGQTGNVPANGCGNQALYQPAASGGPGPASYGGLATLLSNDQFFLDTSKSMCLFYLAVEFGVVTGGTNSTCGGRAPQYDVIDYSFSMLAMGLKGFDTSLQPLFKDNAPVHTDYLTDFPYLGPPHTP